MKKEEKENSKPTEEKTLRGRDKFMEMMRGENAEYAPADDETFLDDIHSRYSKDSEELNGYRGANDALRKRVFEDPESAEFIRQFASGKPIPSIVGSIWGKDFMDVDPEEFEAGYQEYLAKLAKSKEMQDNAMNNIAEFEPRFDAYVAANGYDEETKTALSAKIFESIDGLLNGNISDDFITLVDKGLSYDNDVHEAAVSGEVEAKNAMIDEKLKQDAIMSSPDLLGGGDSPSEAPQPKQVKRRPRDVYRPNKA